MTLPIGPEFIPLEAWWLKNFTLPEDKQPLRFRIVAVAVPQDGWLGFSQPFVIRSVDHLEVFRQLLWILLSAVTSIVVFIAPGLIFRHRRRRLHFIWLPLAGIPLLALLGLLAWVGPAALSARFICRAGLFLLIGYSTYHFFRFPLSTYTTRLERRALLVFLLLVSIGAAKSTYSLGPAGELFAGRISRTFEVGARSDSRFLYHIVQLVRFRESPWGDFATGLFAPWSFSHRGPIAGLAVAPLVLSPRVNVLPAMPDQTWSPFDPQGFEGYRIALIVLACCGLLTVFGLAQLFLPPAWAFFAFLIAVTAPFNIHEIFFTWPKLVEAGFTLLAAWLLFRGRFLFGGLTLGFAYLVHPSALISVPALLGIVILRKRHNAGRYAWLDGAFAMSIGLGIWLGLWRIINNVHYVQDSFLGYFKLTGGLNPPTAANWLRSRLESLLNTLVPLNLFVFEPKNLEVQSIYAWSPTVVRFFFAYWNTLPFGAGIAFFFCGLLRLLYIGFLNARAWFVALFVIPFALFIPYWGWGRSGLMREGLHAWFLGLLLFAVVMWHRYLRRSGLFFRIVNWTLLVSGLETLCVLLLPTIASQDRFTQPPYVLSDAVALIVMFASTAALYAYTFRFAERLRKQNAATVTSATS